MPLQLTPGVAPASSKRSHLSRRKHDPTKVLGELALEGCIDQFFCPADRTNTTMAPHLVLILGLNDFLMAMAP